MLKPTIAVKTSWGSGYGTGHVQRMASLIWHCSNSDRFNAYIWNSRVPPFLSDEDKGLVREKVRPDMIVRDMRDSSRREIRELLKKSPVIAVDDFGEGKAEATSSIDLLPFPGTDPELRTGGCFLYGFTFFRSVEEKRGRKFIKSIDFAFYPGNGNDYCDDILALLPPDSSCAVLSGGQPIISRNGILDEEKSGADYADILLSSRVVISHFGLTLYEAVAAGCRVVAINPSLYHSSLCDSAPADLKLINLGLREEVDPGKARESLAWSVKNPLREEITGEEVYSLVHERQEGFCDYLTSVYNSL